MWRHTNKVTAKLAQAFHNRAGIESLPKAKLAQEPGKWYRDRHSPLMSKSCTDVSYDQGTPWTSPLIPAQGSPK